MTQKRYIVECVWSGYTRAQSKVCHRTVEVGNYALQIAKISCVQFTDNTTMSVSVRPAAKREKVQEVRGYCELLRDFTQRGMTGFVKVDDLHETPEEAAISREIDARLKGGA